MSTSLPTHGTWLSNGTPPAFSAVDLREVIQHIREPVFVVHDPHSGQLGLGLGGQVVAAPAHGTTDGWPLLAALPPLYPEWLGDRGFGQTHGVRFPYIAGAMANGIATTKMVAAMGRAGFLGFFGAGGLGLPQVEAAVHDLVTQLGDTASWGCNLIHSPNEPGLEEAVADLYLRSGVARISAAAYMALTPAVVRYAASGLHQDPQGRIVRTRHVLAKVSHPEVATLFLEPAPAELLEMLVGRGQLTADEARLAHHVAVAEDITVEADSGGHTDNRPLAAIFPTIAARRDEVSAARGYTRPVRIGAAGGLGTPTGVASAFAMGAAYVLTGSVNQACVESGLAPAGRLLLAQASVADVMMCPAADMFEQGVEVQVLGRGTMFGVRARKLYEVYRHHDSIEQIPADTRERIERQMLQATFEQAWDSTRVFWAERDPREVDRAERDPRHKMALIFRSYLGRASRWAIQGDPQRLADYQIWCGPAMGAFNAWCRGSFLDDPARRTVVQVACNLMEGAAVVTRAQQLRCVGVPVPDAAFSYSPRPLDVA